MCIDAIRVLAEVGEPRLVETCLQILLNAESDRCPLRCATINALGCLGDLRAVEPLIKCLLTDMRNRSGGLHKAKIIEALGRLGDNRAIPAIIRALQDPDDKAVIKAVNVLGDSGDPRAIKPVGDLFGAVLRYDTNCHREELPGAVFQALQKLQGNQSISITLKALTTGDDRVRRNAALALCNIRDSKAVTQLVRTLTDEEWEVREAAAKALNTIAPDWSLYSSESGVLKALQEATADVLDTVRKVAVEALTIMAQPSDQTSDNITLAAANTLEKAQRREYQIKQKKRTPPFCQFCGIGSAKQYHIEGKTYWFCNISHKEFFGHQFAGMFVRDIHASGGTVLGSGLLEAAQSSRQIAVYCSKCGAKNKVSLVESEIRNASCVKCSYRIF